MMLLLSVFEIEKNCRDYQYFEGGEEAR